MQEEASEEDEANFDADEFDDPEPLTKQTLLFGLNGPSVSLH